jgi:hypothetical protein
VAALDQLVGGRGEQGDAVFLFFDFFGDADQHGGTVNPKEIFRKEFLS